VRRTQHLEPYKWNPMAGAILVLFEDDDTCKHCLLDTIVVSLLNIFGNVDTCTLRLTFLGGKNTFHASQNRRACSKFRKTLKRMVKGEPVDTSGDRLRLLPTRLTKPKEKMFIVVEVAPPPPHQPQFHLEECMKNGRLCAHCSLFGVNLGPNPYLK
jgi:hypothetical protein